MLPNSRNNHITVLPRGSVRAHQMLQQSMNSGQHSLSQAPHNSGKSLHRNISWPPKANVTEELVPITDNLVYETDSRGANSENMVNFSAITSSTNSNITTKRPFHSLHQQSLSIQDGGHHQPSRSLSVGNGNSNSSRGALPSSAIASNSEMGTDRPAATRQQHQQYESSGHNNNSKISQPPLSVDNNTTSNFLSWNSFISANNGVNPPATAQHTAAQSTNVTAREIQPAVDMRCLPPSRCFCLIDGKVTSLAATPDGKFCIAAFSSGYIRLFDLSACAGAGEEGTSSEDPEDRYGHRIGRIGATSSNISGSLNVVLQTGGQMEDFSRISASQLSSSSSYLSSSSSSSYSSYAAANTSPCCHLFAGAALGSNTMLVIDLVSLRELKARRGFITMVGGGVQVFSHTDARLKGFNALLTVSCSTIGSIRSTGNSSSISSGAGGAAEADTEGEYEASYRLVTGRGMSTYHVWGVVLTASKRSLSAAAAGAAAAAAARDEGSLVYTGSWQVLYSGTVNGPQMMFGAVSMLRNVNNAPYSCSTTAGHCWSTPSNTAAQPLTILTQANDKDLRYLHLLPAPSAASQSGSTECDGGMVSLPIDPTSSLVNLQASCKPTPLKNSIYPKAASASSCTLFCGLDELVVTTLQTIGAHSESIVRSSSSGSSGKGEMEVISLDDGNTALSSTTSLPIDTDLVVVNSNNSNNITKVATLAGAKTVVHRTVHFPLLCDSGAAAASSSSSSSRHFLQIAQVTCVPDAAHALVVCSDNSVLLYSKLNLFGNGTMCSKDKIHDSLENDNSSSSSTAIYNSGYLHMLCQAEEKYRLEPKLDYVWAKTVPVCESGSSSEVVGEVNSDDVNNNNNDGYSLQLQLALSWRLISDPSAAGVLSVVTIPLQQQQGQQQMEPSSSSSSSPPLSTTSSSRATALYVAEQFPSLLCVQGKGLLSHLPAVKEDATAGRGSSSYHRSECGVCGDALNPHWSVLAERVKTATVNSSNSSRNGSSSSNGLSSAFDDSDEDCSETEEEEEEVEENGNNDVDNEQPRIDNDESSSTSLKKRKSGAVQAPTGVKVHGDVKSKASSTVAGSGNSSGNIKNKTVKTGAGKRRKGCVEEPELPYDPNAVLSIVDVETFYNLKQELHTLRNAMKRQGNSREGLVQSLIAQTESLKQEKAVLAAEAERLMRKFDHRIKLELELRKKVRTDEENFLARISALEKEKQRRELNTHSQGSSSQWDKLSVALRYLSEEAAKNGSSNSGSGSGSISSSSTSSSSSSSTNNISNSGGGGSNNDFLRGVQSVCGAHNLSPGTRLQQAVHGGVGKNMHSSTPGSGARAGSGAVSSQLVSFCVICQEHTANVALKPCGHVCMCSMHAQKMQDESLLRECPLCKVACSGHISLTLC